jgi:tetratricopeptide (TPR) repeat protein
VAEAGWLGIVRAHIALYADRNPPQARRLAAAAVAAGRAVGSRDVEMQALAYEGLGLVSEGLVAEGMRKLDESSTAAISGELSGVDEAGTIACCLIAACERVRDLGRAAEWCERLKELCQGWSFELMIAVCRTHYGSTLVSRGQWREAEREFHAAIAGFGHPHRGQVAEAHVRLADLRVRQGRLDEAAELLDTVSSGPDRMLGHKLALAVQAAVALERGDPRTAVDTAEVFLGAIPDRESLERAPALEVLVRAGVALGDEPAARAALAGLRTLADLVRTPPMLAAALAAQGAVANAFGDPTAARVALLDAADLFAEVDAPDERAQATLLLARCLAGSGRREAAAVRAAERHVSNIYLKLGVEGNGARTSAVAAALQHGLVQPAPAGCVRRRPRLRAGTHVPGPPAG